MDNMKTIQAFKFRLAPTAEQEALLNRHAGCVRFVWNKALDLQTRRLDAGIPILSCGDMAKLLTLWRASDEYGFLANGPVHPQQQTLKNLDRALWKALTGNRGFPQDKKKGKGDSLRYPDPLQVKLDLATRDAEGRNLLPRLFLPKVGWVKIRVSRQIGGDLRNATVTRKPDDGPSPSRRNGNVRNLCRKRHRRSDWISGWFPSPHSPTERGCIPPRSLWRS